MDKLIRANKLKEYITQNWKCLEMDMGSEYVCAAIDEQPAVDFSKIVETLKCLQKECDRDITTIAVGQRTRAGQGLVEGRRIGLQEAIDIVLEEMGGLFKDENVHR